MFTEVMPDSVGNRLCKARLARGLTIDEAAHATKMRPDKILALENDDYSRFANNAYAKGFLLIYGRFLRVDVSDQARSLEMPNDIRVAEYQYLSNAPAPTPTRLPRSARTRKPSIAPLIGFVGLVVLGTLGFYLYVTAQRLGNIDNSRKSNTAETPRPSLQEAASPGGGSPIVTPVTPPNPAISANPPSLTAPSSAAGVVPSTSPAAPGATQPGKVIPGVPIGSAPLVAAQNTAPGAPIPPAATPPEVRRAEAVGTIGTARTPVPAASPAPQTAPAAVPPGGVNEITVEAVKKTWVKICRDDPNSPPIFMDYVYPKAGALKLRGARFYIESRDPAAIQIQKNGAPVVYQSPGTIVQ